jgi:hypothetical protein
MPGPVPRRAAAIALATCLLALLIAPAAHAWRELSAYDIPSGGLAQCLRAAGPGEVTLLARPAGQTATTELLDVAAGITPRVATTLGHLDSCAEVGAAPGVAPLLAAVVDRHGKHFSAAMQVATAGGLPQTLRATTNRYVSAPSVAVAPNGAAVVAWSDTDTGFGTRDVVMAAVRAPGAARFGSVVVLDRNASDASDPVAGIDAAGDATVAWMGNQASGDRFGNSLATAEAATALAGGAFGAPQQLVRSSGETIALAVASNGRAMLAADAGDVTGAWERPAATGSFSALALPDLESPEELAVALGPDGGAVLAVQGDGLTATLRPPGGRFGAARSVEPSNLFGGDGFSVDYLGPSHPSDGSAGALAAALGAGGDVVLSWVDSSDASHADAAQVVRGTLGGGLGRRTRLGTPCRAASAATPVTLRDGRLGVAWTDAARVASDHGLEDPRGGGRLHVATPDAAVPDPHALPPELSAEVVGPRALHVGESLRIRVRCRRGPCDVRAVASAFRIRPTVFRASAPVAASTALGTGRSATLELSPSSGRTFAHRRAPTPTAVTLIACGATGAVAAPLTLHPRLSQVAPPPLPRVLDVRARRHGNAIHVTWRTSIPARGVSFVVWSQSANNPEFGAERAGHGHIHFSVTLHPRDAAHVRRVGVAMQSDDAGIVRTVAVVRVQ